MTEDEMVGWHHRLDGHEFEEALGDVDGQGSLACCSPWGGKESNMSATEPNIYIYIYIYTHTHTHTHTHMCNCICRYPFTKYLKKMLEVFIRDRWLTLHQVYL